MTHLLTGAEAWFPRACKTGTSGKCLAMSCTVVLMASRLEAWLCAHTSWGGRSPVTYLGNSRYDYWPCSGGFIVQQSED